MEKKLLTTALLMSAPPMDPLTLNPLPLRGGEARVRGRSSDVERTFVLQSSITKTGNNLTAKRKKIVERAHRQYGGVFARLVRRGRRPNR